jgi:hypothetical protein
MFTFQRYLIMYVMNKVIFQADIQPAVVVRLRSFKGSVKNKERTNFLISLLLPSDMMVHDIQDFKPSSQDPTCIVH